MTPHRSITSPGRGLLELLVELVAVFDCVTTSPVRQELADGAGAFSVLRDVEQLDWMTIVDCISLEEVYVFSQYMNLLGNTERNAGEATVLAWAETNDAFALVDDQVACNQGRRRGVEVRRSLSLIIDGVRRGVQTESEAQAAVRDLAESGMYLPHEAVNDLFGWARLHHIW